jgi:PAS domain-containing protein
VGQSFRQWVRAVEVPQGEGQVVDWYLKQSGEERASERYAFFFHGPQGEPRQAEVQVLLQQEEGAARRYLQFRDVTAYNRLEEEVRSLRRQIGTLVHGSRPGLLLVDVQGTILASDGTVSELLGLPRDALVGRPLWEAFAKAEGSHLLPEQIARAYREGSGYVELALPDKWPTPLGATLTLLLGSEGTPQAVVVLFGPALPASAG